MATKVFVSACLLALFVYLLARFRAVITPLILAGIVAYVLSPAAGFLQRRLRLPRGWATLVTYLGLVGLLALLPAIFVPVLVDQLAGLDLNFRDIVLNIETILGRGLAIGGWHIDPAQMVDQVSQALRGLFEPVFGQTLVLAIDVITSIVWLVFIAVVSFYLVKDGPRLRAWAEQQVPQPYRTDAQRLLQEVGLVWSAFFRGQIVLALVVAGIITCAGFILGLPFALAMGALAGLLEFLPSIGHGIWLFTASLLMFFQGSSWLPIPNWLAMLLVIGLHLVFQQVDLNLLIPRIIGRRVRLHPLVVILGIVAGAAMAGVLGILLAAPTIASARILGRYLLANLLDLDPFADDLSEGAADGPISAA
ncbi:MAG: AI-2E family transporter [Chloroflexota bacterium]